MDIITIPCLYDNYSYLLIDSEQRQAAVVDPGEAWPVLREIQGRDLQLAAVLCTHHHHDHVGGIDDLLDQFPAARVFGFHADAPRISQLTDSLQDGEELAVCGQPCTVLHTPGHTTNSIVYRCGDDLFVGDTLFGAGCGRLFEGTAEQLAASLARIVACGPQARVHFGHEYTMQNLRFASQMEPGNEQVVERMQRVAEMRQVGRPSTPSTVAEELATNPFLRVDAEEIIATLREQHGVADHSPLAVFRSLRQLRNEFS